MGPGDTVRGEPGQLGRRPVTTRSAPRVAVVGLGDGATQLPDQLGHHQGPLGPVHRAGLGGVGGAGVELVEEPGGLLVLPCTALTSSVDRARVQAT